MKTKLFFLIHLLAFAPLVYSSDWDDPHEDIIHRATDETAYLSKLQMLDLYTPKNFGACSSSNIGRIKAIEAIKAQEPFPFDIFLRQTIQVQNVAVSPSTNCERQFGFGDTQFLVLNIYAYEWGRWGFGATAIFPTATRPSTGQGKWQLGPAGGITILAVPDWQFHLLLQNAFTFAGPHNRPYINQLLCQPIISHHLGDGWYLRSDAEWTITWSSNSATIPVNLGLGRVFDIFTQKVNFTAYSQWTAYHRNTSTAKWTLKVELDMLFPD